jgi:hypothetical protein
LIDNYLCLVIQFPFSFITSKQVAGWHSALARWWHGQQYDFKLVVAASPQKQRVSRE